MRAIEAVALGGILLSGCGLNTHSSSPTAQAVSTVPVAAEQQLQQCKRLSTAITFLHDHEEAKLSAKAQKELSIVFTAASLGCVAPLGGS